MTAELRLLPAQPQELLAYAPFHRWSMPDGSAWMEFHRAEAGAFLLRFPALADFLVSPDGTHVVCTPAIGSVENPENIAHHLYVNQVLPLALSQQGKMVFHASAVEVPAVEGAVAFVAVSGRGKSTLAAHFALHGHRFLTDDGLLLEQRAGAPGAGFDVLPSHPSIRLWEDSEEALIAPGTPTAPALQFTPKARFLAGDQLAHCDHALPLRAVYFLGDGSAEQLTIRPLTAGEALREWMAHSFLLDVDDKARLATHFADVSKLAAHPIHFALDYPRRYEDLPPMREAVLEHTTQAGASRQIGSKAARTSRPA